MYIKDNGAVNEQINKLKSLHKFKEWKNNTENADQILSDLCIKCQKCCKQLGIYTSYLYDDNPDVIEFYEVRGFRTKKSNEGILYIYFNNICPNLNTTGCSIYENRPQVCRHFNGIIDFGSDCLWNNLIND